MHFWYLMIASSSILENIAGTPFSHQYTIRVSRAPEVRISRAAPLVVRNDPNPRGQSSELSYGKSPSVMSAPGSSRLNLLSMRAESSDTAARTRDFSYSQLDAVELLPVNGSDRPREPGLLDGAATADVQVTDSATTDRRGPARAPTSTELLDALETGYNTTGRLSLDSDEWSAHRVPFYVIVSLEGITTGHAMLRILSKAISVSVFATGTALFAGTSLIPISLAWTVLFLVLGVGVFGRVVAM